MYYVTRKLKMCYARYEKPQKNHPLEVAKKFVEMQQHMYINPRKGYNFISLDITQYTNAKEKEKTSEEDD